MEVTYIYLFMCFLFLMNVHLAEGLHTHKQGDSPGHRVSNNEVGDREALFSINYSQNTSAYSILTYIHKLLHIYTQTGFPVNLNW